jgi:hypothetical protein
MEATILLVRVNTYNSYKECIESLTNQGCKDLGWLNNHHTIIPDNLKWNRVYSNNRGIEVHVELKHRLFYSLDCGD